MTHTETLVKPAGTPAAENAVEELKTGVSDQELARELSLGERVRAEFEAVWSLYPNRRQGTTVHVGPYIFEDDGLATRYYDKALGIEETYFRSRIYDRSVELKTDPGPSEAIFVRVASESGEEHEIFVNPAGSVAVMCRQGVELPWQTVSEQEALACIDELSYRAVIAAVRHGERTPDEQVMADTHARELLRARMPMFAASETSLE